MALTRRDALKLGTAGVVAGCSAGGADSGDTGDALPTWPGLRPEALTVPEPLDLEGFGLGVAAGDPSPEAATLWARASRSEGLALVVHVHDGAGWTPESVTPVTPDDHGMVHVRHAHAADTAWRSFYFRDASGRSELGTWRAPPADGDWVVTFGGSSCTKLDGAPFPVLSRASEGGLGFFLYGGDNVYADSAETADEYRALYAEYLAQDGFRAIRSGCGGYACWDDHEVQNDWGTVVPGAAEEAAGIAAFYEHHPTEQRDPPVHYRSFRIGDTVALFVLDCRSERSPDDGLYISEDQLQWLLDGIAASDAAFKLVLNSVPIADLTPLFSTVNQEDRWSGYPEQRQRVVDALDGVPGVFFLSGDIHMGLVARVAGEGPGHGLWDVAMGPGGSRGNAIAELMSFDDRFPFATSVHTWCRFTANPGTGRLRVEFIDGDGVVMYDEELESVDG